MVAAVGPGVLEVVREHRFGNVPVRLPDGLHTDALALYRHTLDGLAGAGPLATVGVDAWGVDYGLLDGRGALLGNPYCYRDARTADAVEKVHTAISPRDLFQANGLQMLPFTTLYQLAAAADTAELQAATSLLLIPDLIGYWLTGSLGAEVTNASTTGLLDVRTRSWSAPLIDAAGVSLDLLPALRRPGEPLGAQVPWVREQTGLTHETSVVAVGSHDTASAVVGVPMEGEDAAYVSLGTWGLVGVELERPVLTEAARGANFTNEIGVDDRVRFLRNVMGLWLLQESVRAWQRRGLPGCAVDTLLAGAAAVPRAAVIDVDDPRLLPPGDMPARIGVLVEEAGWSAPATPTQVVRTILDSLADAIARTVRDAARLSGRQLSVVHVVGGGARNTLLCQLICDASGLPVIAGPAEATAIGNLLVQARAHGSVTGDLDSLRALVRRTQPLTHFLPRARPRVVTAPST